MHVFLAYIGLLLVDVPRQLLESFLSRILLVHWSGGYQSEKVSVTVEKLHGLMMTQNFSSVRKSLSSGGKTTCFDDDPKNFVRR